ncbi:MAG: MYXO-CTERM sorting domain-containing protein [Myxococcaceae bacterium]|nr:MYXO-CTERM sorting domain-containing protein [Myxococcaceae bacterium]
MKRAWLVSLVAGATLAAEPNYLPFRMLSSQASPFQYYLDSRLPSPANLSINFTRPAAEAAWSQWSSVACAMPKMVSQGFTTGVVPRPEDRFDVYNVTPVWVTSTSAPDTRDLFFGGFTAAIATPEDYAGVLQTCDVFLNALMPVFSAEPSGMVPPGTIDFQSVMTHEAGHCLGLDHFGLGVMIGNVYFAENKRFLQGEDVTAFCARNPATGKVGAPCTGAGTCDMNLQCVTVTGNQGPSRYCASPCVPNTTPCPLPMQCLPASGFPGTTTACQYPPANQTQIGRACTMHPECNSLVGTCLRESQAATGTTIWSGGYCTQSCEAGQPACPAGSVCVPATSGSRLCVRNCRVGLADCRPGYSCDALSATTGNEGICIPSCRVEGDCVDPVVNGQVVDYECRVCDGRCVPKQSSGAPIGTICTTQAQCGVGQTCRQAEARLPTQQCTASCGRGCGTCPTGAACIPDDRGELFCLKTCSGRGSCGTGLRCKTFAGVQACVPMCQLDLDCPVGQRCIEGECELPVDPNDAGCTVFCTPPDAGMMFRPRPDGGPMTGGGSAGCACSTPGGFGPMLGLVGLALAARRRRR